MVGVPLFDLPRRIATNYVSGAGAVLTTTAMTTTDTAVIVMIVVNTADQSSTPPNFTTVQSVTGGGLTFSRYAQAALSGVDYSQSTGVSPFFVNSTGGVDVEVWWAPAPSVLTAVQFTVTMANPIVRCGISAVAAYGCGNINAPWDTHPGLPVIGSAATGGTSISLSTTSTYTALMLFVADFPDQVVNTDPGPAFHISGLPGGGTVPLTVSQVGNVTPLAPSFDGTGSQTPSIPAVSALSIQTVEDTGPLNAIILIGAALAGVSPVPPSSTVLNMDNVKVTSLATESPCTVAQFLTPPDGSPAVGLRWSDTRGHTFGNAVPQILTDDPLAQLQWNRTGYARDRVFELFWSAAVKTALNGAFVIAEPWKS